MGQEIVLFRTRGGSVAAVDAYSAHLGAHLGYGGTVEGECIRCPFHGFQYRTDGQCTLVPYGTKAPPLAKLRTLPLRERHGLILAYHDGDGLQPSWEIPIGHTGLVAAARQGVALARSPAGDLREQRRHRAFLADPSLHQRPGVEGRHRGRPVPECDVHAMVRPAPVIGTPIETEFDVHVRGLGYSIVDVRLRSSACRRGCLCWRRRPTAARLYFASR